MDESNVLVGLTKGEFRKRLYSASLAKVLRLFIPRPNQSSTINSRLIDCEATTGRKASTTMMGASLHLR